MSQEGEKYRPKPSTMPILLGREEEEDRGKVKRETFYLPAFIVDILAFTDWSDSIQYQRSLDTRPKLGHCLRCQCFKMGSLEKL